MSRLSEQNGIIAVPPAQSILDAITGPVVVLDPTGTIIAVNRAWHRFGEANGAPAAIGDGVNYLDICDRAVGADGPCARAAAAGIRSVLAGKSTFSLEYPCHSPTETRWFKLQASRLVHDGVVYAVVAHHDITDRILVEQERQALLARAHRHQEQLRSLAAACARIASEELPATIFRDATEEARRIIGAHWASTHTIPYVLWPENPIIVSVSDKYRAFSSSALAESGVGIYTHVVQTKRPLRMSAEELSHYPELQGVRNAEADLLMTEGLIAVPIPAASGGMLGVLMLSDKEYGDFTADDEAILVQLSQITSVAAENSVRKRAERESRERLWATHEHASVGIGETDAAGRFLTVNKGLSSITGYSRDELLVMTLFDLVPSDGVEAEKALYDRQIAGELKTYTLERRCIRKDGTNVWLHVSSTAVFGEHGQFQYSVRVIQDIDQRKRFEQRQALLVRELHHRVRNTLAVVEALASATARSATNVRQFNHTFSSRIAALARTQSLLTEDYWQTALLRDMLLCELRPFEERRHRRFILEGPEVNLTADLAIPLSMALHELATNAARYGALSVRKGCVAVRWDVGTTDGMRALRLTWVERNGPPVEPPAHHGFGFTLLERVLQAQCRATVRLSFEPGGLEVHIELPLTMNRAIGRVETSGVNPDHR
ncbi:PAS domain S-box protein [Microvirga terrae]|uniref:Blue-light-activated histidine kinase n=1 Tax=Microvirga terrae TaxID=2740529 RepID=A0ABY5RX65_9HYPH|nr:MULTISPECIES: PAS domain S-box protein [Microvirga]MBQ0824417.1 PAS domain S-box protein [Microvirga sp. HBU67558]UVF21850.1 PAS domain S-box protein [Microvirga terrae]